MTEQYTRVVSQDDWEAWLKAHLSGIGASECAALFGEHPYKSALRVWAEKTGRLDPPELADAEAAYWGKTLEDLVAGRFQEKTGREVAKAGTLLRSVAHPWAICTPDYWQSSGIPLQIKTVNAFRIDDWAEGPPRSVWMQVQHEMLVTGAPLATVAALVGGQRLIWQDIDRDDEFIGDLIERGEAFWEYVQSKAWPAGVADGGLDETSAIEELWPTVDNDKVVALDTEAQVYDATLQSIEPRVKDLERAVQALRNEIKIKLGSAQLGQFPDGSGYSLKTTKRKETVIKASEFRVLRRVKAKG